jgi:hypothetical protein
MKSTMDWARVSGECVAAWRGVGAIALALSVASGPAAAVPRKHVLLEAFPDGIGRTLTAHNLALSAAANKSRAAPDYIAVPDTRLWKAGSTITVAFKGGDQGLHEQIEAAAKVWTQTGVANLTLDFRKADGKFRTWKTTDKVRNGQIRVSFDQKGLWSLLGSDAADDTLKGGKVNQASMNLAEFDTEPPDNWRSTVIHEFGHALGFEHEHQRPVVGCDFRFDDAPGYVKTQDSEGWFIPDTEGREPGLYTYLGGPENDWPKEQVDDNLRAIETTLDFATGPFDRTSIMKYFFPDFFFVGGEHSACYTGAEATDLSEQDIAGAQRIYPAGPQASVVSADRARALREIASVPGLSRTLKRSMENRLSVIDQ